MIDPKRQRQLSELNAVEICSDILYAARNELYVNMPFLDVALSSLRFEAAGTKTLAVDGECIFYQPEHLMQLFLKGRVLVNRSYFHMLLHCLFGHLWNYGKRDPQLWNLACDIAVESMVDAQLLPCLHVPPAAAKREMYLRLKRHGLTLFSAELIYQKLQELQFDERRIRMLQQVFLVDEHEGWYQSDKPQASMARQTQWQDRREKMQTAMETGTREPSEGSQTMQESLVAANRERYDYRQFLKKFAVLKEETGIDPDSYDPVFYTFGLEHYGNMPLIEPLETKEVFRVEDFVIVIDTSMSTNGALVRRFLEETYDVLSTQGSYFRSINVHILQCDDQVRDDAVIHSAEELKAYMEQLVLHGNGGTDFRPAFAYVEQLIRQQRFQKLKGLLYFTDGKGIYPVKSTPYDTAFVFIEDNYEDVSVPPWAMKLILTGEELVELQGTNMR